MKILKLEAKEFRNFSDLSFEADPKINVIFGNNAQGKTNLMEALWLFTGNRSFRGAREQDMIAFGKENARLSVSFECEGRNQEAQLILGEKKKLSLNQVPLRSASEFAGRYYAVVFSPTDLSFIKDGPERRRRFLDIAVSQLKPVYQKYLAQYNRVLIQRNALLRDMYYRPSLEETLNLWEEQLAKLGTILTSFRIDYLKKLDGFAAKIYRGISNDTEEVVFRYVSTIFAEMMKRSAMMTTRSRFTRGCLRRAAKRIRGQELPRSGYTETISTFASTAAVPVSSDLRDSKEAVFLR